MKKVPRKIFSNDQLGWLTKGYMFLAKKGYNSMAKRVQFNKNRKKGYTTSRLGPKKDTQQLTYVVQNLKCGESPFLARNHRGVPFFGHGP